MYEFECVRLFVGTAEYGFNITLYLPLYRPISFMLSIFKTSWFTVIFDLFSIKNIYVEYLIDSLLKWHKIINSIN